MDIYVLDNRLSTLTVQKPHRLLDIKTCELRLKVGSEGVVP